MDVNEALKRAREACTEARKDAEAWQRLCDEADKQGVELHTERSAVILDTLCEHFEAIDQWLVRGGFLPKDWERKP